MPPPLAANQTFSSHKSVIPSKLSFASFNKLIQSAGGFTEYADTSKIRIYNKDNKSNHMVTINRLDSKEAKEFLGNNYQAITEEIALIKGVYEQFDIKKYLSGSHTPVFFGTALHNFGIKEFLECITEYAPSPQPRITKEREIYQNV